MERQSFAAVEGGGEQRGISMLPRDMKESIFGKLPSQSISVSRMVCKEWNSILSSHSFLLSLPTQNPWLLICGQETDGNWYCTAYCFFTQEWRTTCLSFLPNTVGGKRICKELDGFHSVTFADDARDLLSSAQGLLLFRVNIAPQLCVCNPLMRSYAEIEMNVTEKFIRIVQGGNREPYLVLCANSEKFSFQIYHYFQDSWRIKSQFSGERGSNILEDEMVECNGVLFWRGELPTTIVGYNIEDGFINPVTVSPLPLQLVEDQNLTDIFMVAYGSSVLVVGTFKEPSEQVLDPFIEFEFEHCDQLPNQTGIVIWELFQSEEDKLVWQWKEFARMPPQSLPEYLDGGWWYQNCVCVGDYLCFSSLLGWETAKVFAYNLREGLWQRLPPCKRYRANSTMMSFEPKFIHEFLRKLEGRVLATPSSL